jgi:hypothetical protein
MPLSGMVLFILEQAIVQGFYQCPLARTLTILILHVSPFNIASFMMVVCCCPKYNEI